jgi:hypothetical protein
MIVESKVLVDPFFQLADIKRLVLVWRLAIPSLKKSAVDTVKPCMGRLDKIELKTDSLF